MLCENIFAGATALNELNEVTAFGLPRSACFLFRVQVFSVNKKRLILQ